MQIPCHENSFRIPVKKEEGFKLARGPLRPWGGGKQDRNRNGARGRKLVWAERVGGKDNRAGEFQARWMPYPLAQYTGHSRRYLCAECSTSWALCSHTPPKCSSQYSVEPKALHMAPRKGHDCCKKQGCNTALWLLCHSQTDKALLSWALLAQCRGFNNE